MPKQPMAEFLSDKRLAFVGVSRNPTKFSNKVYEKLKRTGYELHPIHPQMESIDGDTCVPTIRNLPPDIRSLIIVSGLDVCLKTLKDLPGTSIRSIWLFPAHKNRPDIQSEIQRLRDSGITIISGPCPFMYLEPVDSVHAVHRFVARLVGRYGR